MADFLHALGALLIGNGVGFAELPEDAADIDPDQFYLMYSFMPPGPERLIVVSEYAAGLPGIRSTYRPIGIQLRVRAEPESIGAARDIIEAAFDVLHGNDNRYIGAYWVVRLEAQQAAFPVTFDQANRRPEYVSNFVAVLSR